MKKIKISNIPLSAGDGNSRIIGLKNNVLTTYPFRFPKSISGKSFRIVTSCKKVREGYNTLFNFEIRSYNHNNMQPSLMLISIFSYHTGVVNTNSSHLVPNIISYQITENGEGYICIDVTTTGTSVSTHLVAEYMNNEYDFNLYPL